jgi:hypothetical protein
MFTIMKRLSQLKYQASHFERFTETFVYNPHLRSDARSSSNSLGSAGK